MTRSTKRARRKKADLEALKAALYNVVAENEPVTVRQAYYQLVSAGAISKTEADYKNIVVRLLGIAGELS